MDDSHQDAKLAQHLKSIPESKMDLKQVSQWQQEVQRISDQYKQEYVQMQNEYRKAMQTLVSGIFNQN